MPPLLSDIERTRADAMLHTVKAETGFGPGDEPLPFVREVARRLGYPWGLNGKRGNVNDISSDILAFDIPNQQPILVDVLIDSGGRNELTFDLKPWPEPAGAIFIQVSSPGPSPLPPLPQDEFNLAEEVRAIQTRLDSLLARKPSAYVGRLFGFPIRLTPE